jgi:hypothetical protein
MLRRVRQRIGNLPPADRVAWLCVLVFAVGAAAMIATRNPGDADSSGGGGARPTSAKSDVPTRNPPPPTCKEVLEETGKDPIGTCRAASGILLTIGVQNRPLLVGPLTARVVDAGFRRATTPAGQARNRARLSVTVSLLNHSKEEVDIDWSLIDLSVGGIRIAPDRAAAQLPGGWRIGQMPAGERRRGELRFETAGGVTDRLIATSRADLAVRLEEKRVGVIRLRVPETT